MVVGAALGSPGAGHVLNAADGRGEVNAVVGVRAVRLGGELVLEVEVQIAEQLGAAAGDKLIKGGLGGLIVALQNGLVLGSSGLALPVGVAGQAIGPFAAHGRELGLGSGVGDGDRAGGDIALAHRGSDGCHTALDAGDSAVRTDGGNGFIGAAPSDRITCGRVGGQLLGLAGLQGDVGLGNLQFIGQRDEFHIVNPHFAGEVLIHHADFHLAAGLTADRLQFVCRQLQLDGLPVACAQQARLAGDGTAGQVNAQRSAAPVGVACVVQLDLGAQHIAAGVVHVGRVVTGSELDALFADSAGLRLAGVGALGVQRVAAADFGGVVQLELELVGGGNLGNPGIHEVLGTDVAGEILSNSDLAGVGGDSLVKAVAPQDVALGGFVVLLADDVDGVDPDITGGARGREHLDLQVAGGIGLGALVGGVKNLLHTAQRHLDGGPVGDRAAGNVDVSQVDVAVVGNLGANLHFGQVLRLDAQTQDILLAVIQPLDETINVHPGTCFLTVQMDGLAAGVSGVLNDLPVGLAVIRRGRVYPNGVPVRGDDALLPGLLDIVVCRGGRSRKVVEPRGTDGRPGACCLHGRNPGNGEFLLRSVLLHRGDHFFLLCRGFLGCDSLRRLVLGRGGYFFLLGRGFLDRDSLRRLVLCRGALDGGEGRYRVLRRGGCLIARVGRTVSGGRFLLRCSGGVLGHLFRRVGVIGLGLHSGSGFANFHAGRIHRQAVACHNGGSHGQRSCACFPTCFHSIPSSF